MRTCSTIIIMLSALLVQGQNSYSFEQDVQTFAHILNGTSCTFGPDSLDVFNELDGETFWFYGIPFTFNGDVRIAAHRSGGLRVLNGCSMVLLYGLYADLYFADPATRVVYTVAGAPGEKILTVEWAEWGISGAPNIIASWKVLVFQETGVIEYHYSSGTPSLVFDDITGPLVGVAHLSDDLTQVFEKLWVEQNALDPTLDSIPDADLDGLHNLPTAHTVFRFVPRFSISTGLLSADDLIGSTVWYDVNNETIRLRSNPSKWPEQCSLYDLQGHLLRTWQIETSEADLYIPSFPSGTYIIQWGNDVVRRFVKP